MKDCIGKCIRSTDVVVVVVVVVVAVVVAVVVVVVVVVVVAVPVSPVDIRKLCVSAFTQKLRTYEVVFANDA